MSIASDLLYCVYDCSLYHIIRAEKLFIDEIRYQPNSIVEVVDASSSGQYCNTTVASMVSTGLVSLTYIENILLAHFMVNNFDFSKIALLSKQHCNTSCAKTAQSHQKHYGTLMVQLTMGILLVNLMQAFILTSVDFLYQMHINSRTM